MAVNDPEGIYQEYEGSVTFSQPVPERGPIIPKLEGTYYFGGEYIGQSVGVLSFNSLETYDLISEGEVEGLVTGYYSYSGEEGNLGWASKTFTQYQTPSGLSDTPWLRSIFWNEIPLVDSDGKYNFSSFNVSVSRGTEDGYVLTDSSSNNEVTVTRPIGERLRAASNPVINRVNPYADDYAKTYRITNKDVLACYVDVRVPSLYRQVIDQELNTYSTEVVYSIYYRAIYSNPTKIKEFTLGKEEKIEGNINTDYVRRSRIEFPASNAESDFVAWEIKIIRETEDSTSTYLQNKSFVEAITEIYENNFLYPKCSIARTKFDAREFNGIPDRYYHMRLKKIQVPNNYDPELRSYGDSTLSTTTGVQGTDYWNGEFKTGKEFSNNPAWVLYDILTDKTYGLGNKVSESDVSASKWDLYQIAKECDTLVSDGEGGLEPKFTCNTYINRKEEAYKVINDLSSVFNGIPYYQGGTIFFSQDRAKGDPSYTFTNANVEDGNFTYFSTSKKNRYTVAVVRYNDKNNYYRPNFEYVEDVDGIKRYGIQEIELTSFATTSRGQAVRAGRWTLESSKQKETVSFVAGLEAQTLRIGDLFQVHDSNRKGFYEGGRIFQCFTTGTGLAIDLDREIELTAGKDYEVKVLGSTFRYDPVRVSVESSNDYSNIKRTFVQTATIDNSYISSLSDGRSRILFPSSGVFDFSGYDLFTNNNIWTINLASGEDTTNESIGSSSDQYSYYTCVNISESQGNKYEIVGLEYLSSKFDTVSSEITPEYSDVVQNKILNGPNNLSLTYSSLDREISYEFDPISSELLSHYEVFVKAGSDPDPSSDEATFVLSKSTTSGVYSPTENGTYYFRVYSVSTNGTRSSSYTSSSISVTGITLTENTIISSLQIDPNSVLKEGDQSNDSGTTFFEEYLIESPTFSWQVGYSSALQNRNNSYRITIRPPSNSNTPDSTIYHQETGYQSPFLADTSPNYTYNITTNSLEASGGPHRHYDVVVESYDPSDQTTSAGNQLNSALPFPSVVSETWSNSNGYDILEVNNYPVTGYRMTNRATGETSEESINAYGSQIATDQWISTDGSIKFTITSGASGTDNLPDNMIDMYGAYIYYRASDFTSGDAYSGGTGIGYAEIPLYAENFGFGNVYTADAQLPDTTNEQYVSISIMDRFDYFAIKAGNAGHRTGLGMSNTVKINRRGVGAPTGAQYVLLGSDPDLPNSRVLVAGTGLLATNDGTNIRLDFDPYLFDLIDPRTGDDSTDQILLLRNSMIYRSQLGGSPDEENASLLSSFGENSVADNFPFIQVAPVQNYMPSSFRTFTSNGGEAGVENREFKANTNTGVNAYGTIQSFRGLNYKAGQGGMARYTARFADGGVADSWQGVGLFSIGDEFSFGYNGTGFGIWHRYNGLPEVRNLTFGAGAGGSETATITINGSAYNVPITAGTTQENAYEVSRYFETGSGYDFATWQRNDAVGVSFLSDGAKTGTFGFSSSTASASWSQLTSGITKTSDFIPQTGWNIDTRTGLDPTKGNVYQINYQYLGYGGIRFSVENPDTAKFEPVHLIKYANKNTSPSVGDPSLKLGLYATSLGSTQDIRVYSASMAAFSQGKVEKTLNPKSYSNIKTVGTSFTNIFTLKNRREVNGYQNQAEIELVLLTAFTESAKGATIEVRSDQTVTGPTNFQLLETNGLAEIDSTGTTVTSNGSLITSAVVPSNSSTFIDLEPLRLRLPPSSQITISAKVNSGAASEVGCALVWYEDI